MLDINRVEANYGGVKTDVRFGNVTAVIIRGSVFGEMSFCAVKGVEKGFDCFFIGFLCSVPWLVI